MALTAVVGGPAISQLGYQFVLWPVLRGGNPRYLTIGIGALGIALYTALHPKLQRRRALELEEVLDRPPSEQLAPDRPERQEV